MALDKLTVPALYTINSTQPDTRQIEITVNLLFEGTCQSKHLFSLEAINAAAPDVQNISIADEEGTCGVGVIPESAGSRWAKLLVGGKWRNYLQVDALLWTKMQDKLPDFENNRDFYNIEVDLINIDAELQDDGLYAVSTFQVGGCRLTSQQIADYTAFTNRYGSLPKR